MRRFKTRLVIAFLFLIFFISLSYLIFLLQISGKILIPEAVVRLRGAIILSVILITLLAILGALVIAAFLTEGITRPIKRINQAVRGLANRDLEQHIKIRSYAEIDELVSSFNASNIALPS